MHPHISICLPTLNAGPFLRPRLESIFAQTYPHWELVAVDNFSNDGTWEHLQQAATTEPRMRILQARREGMYANWNNTLREARGDFLYVATADDTMDPQCLEVLVNLIHDRDLPCIAQCGLSLIDEHGNALHEDSQWPANTEWHTVFGPHFEKSHERHAPFDGTAVMLFGTVITSITQALFPREAFLRFGGFPNHLGSAGDMAWEGLLGFFYDVRYTPERLATWRHHSTQATRNPQVDDDDWSDRRVAVGDWILEKLQLHSESLYRKAHAAGLDAYNRFSRVRSQTTRSRAVSDRWVALRGMTVQCPRFYARYVWAKWKENLRHHNCDPVTQARAEVASRFLGYSIQRPFALAR